MRVGYLGSSLEGNGFRHGETGLKRLIVRLDRSKVMQRELLIEWMNAWEGREIDA
jgi:hypothetical protein